MLLGAFIVVVGYAVEGMEPDCAVCHRQSDETTFEFLELGLVGFRFPAIGFPLLLRPLSVDLLHVFIVGVLEVFGCYQRWGMEVSAHTLQHLDVVEPHTRCLEYVSGSLGDLDGVPIFFNLLRMLAEIAEHFDVSGFHQRLGFGIGEQLLKECHGVYCVATSFEPVAIDGVG